MFLLANFAVWDRRTELFIQPIRECEGTKGKMHCTLRIEEKLGKKKLRVSLALNYSYNVKGFNS